MAAASIYPTFRYRDAAKMIDWLAEAFGFAVSAKFTDGDAVTHAELSLGGAMIMVGDVRDDAYGAWSADLAIPAANRPTSRWTTSTRSTPGQRRPARKSWRSLSTATTAAATSSAPIPQGNVWSFGTYRPKAKE